MELSGEKLTSYLQTVAELEASLNEQEKIINETRENVVYEEPELPPKEMVKEPIMRGKYHVSLFSGSDIKLKKIVIGIILILFAVYFAFISIKDLLDGNRIAISGLIIVVPCAAFALYFLCRYFIYEVIWIGIIDEIISTIRLNKDRLPTYEKELAEYHAKVARAEQDYARAMVSYQNRLDISKKAFDSAKNMLATLENTYSETKRALEKYYGLDVIFPKYRNLIAMCTILEYFQTGRCAALSGPDGAYNLYESEVRQNLIINKLDRIIDSLDQIKNNQFVLYQALESINRNTAQMSGALENIMQYSKQTAISAKVTAYSAKVTEKNAKALTDYVLYS